jgi:3-dehydroquinate synthase
MREGGLVVALTAPFEELLSRVDDATTRPLFESTAEGSRALYEERAAVYRQAHFGVRTEGRRPGEIAGTIFDLATCAELIPDYALVDGAIVALSDRSYPVIVAPGSLHRVGELARRVLGSGCRQVGIISDSNVAPLYGARVREAFEAEEFTVAEATIPAGEPSKQIDSFARLADEMALAGLDRCSAIVALGGGVVGDLAGYVAASLFRGITCIQVPTTVLAMVDAAIGGKTGINIAAGKNLLGAFLQPAFVLADPEVLATLPVRERRAAFGELVKYALLDGEELYGLVDQLAPGLGREWPSGAGLDDGAGDEPMGFEIPVELIKVIRRCVAIKSWIVSRDEREQSGERTLLNLGHTVGHAIEVATEYEGLLHGEAVALGLIAACRVARQIGKCEGALEERVTATLERAGLDVDLDEWISPRRGEAANRGGALTHLGVDKKRTGSRIRFVTVSKVGAPFFAEIEVAELARILRQ